jgi:hypothetical protein
MAAHPMAGPSAKCKLTSITGQQQPEYRRRWLRDRLCSRLDALVPIKRNLRVLIRKFPSADLSYHGRSICSVPRVALISPSPTCTLVLEWARWPHLMCVVGTETFIHLRRQCRLCDLHILASVLLDRNRNGIACGKCLPQRFIQHIFDMGSWRRGRWISRHGVAPCKAMTRPVRCRRRKRRGQQTGARKTVPIRAVKEPISISGEPTAERRPTKFIC